MGVVSSQKVALYYDVHCGADASGSEASLCDGGGSDDSPRLRATKPALARIPSAVVAASPCQAPPPTLRTITAEDVEETGSQNHPGTDGGVVG